jgi:hypothetical protein
LDEEKSKHMGLAHLAKIIFCSAEFAEAGKMWTSKANTCFVREECNGYDLTITSYLSLVNHNDLSRWFAISSLPPICSSSFRLMGGVGKKKT